MRKSVKGIAALSAAALLALGMSVTAFAKDDIEDVSGRLEIRFDGEEPEAGDNMDDQLAYRRNKSGFRRIL